MNSPDRSVLPQSKTADLRRNAKVKSGLVVIKRRSKLSKASSRWEKSLEQIRARSVTPVFPHLAKKSVPLSLMYHIAVPDEIDVFEAAEKLMDNAEIEWAEPVYLSRLAYVPDDSLINRQWHIEKMQCPLAWDLFQGDTTVIIAIIDTGVEMDHPDLKANIWKNPIEIDNGLDDDGNGYIDDIYGWDFGENDPNPSPSEDPIADTKRFHGTAVAGAATAVTDNHTGIAAPAFNAKIMAVKTSEDDDPEQYVNAAYLGIAYAAANGAHVINCSFGNPYASNANREVINFAVTQGAVVVAAAGNDANFSSDYPGAYPKVLSVAATDQSDQLVFYSNYGPDVDISAPGSSIYTTDGNHTYNYSGGTSLATPMVAGVAALVRGYHRDWTGDQVREQVRVSALPIDQINPGYQGYLGWGRVDAYRALTVAMPSIAITHTMIEESQESSNKNGIFEPGEHVEIRFTIKNYLALSEQIVMSFSTTNTDITIENPQILMPALNMMDSVSNTDEPLHVSISDQAETNQDAIVFVRIQSGLFVDEDQFSFEIDYDYGTIEAKDVLLTLTSRGRLGFADYPDQEKGVGFVYQKNDNLLFEGTFMAAVSADSISDAARSANIDIGNTDFTTITGGRLTFVQPGYVADVAGHAAFTDAGAPNSLNLEIQQTAYAFKNDPDGDYILISYQLTSNSPHSKCYAGLFMDWDVGNNGINSDTNLPGFDSGLHLAYIFDPITNMYAGLQIFPNNRMVQYCSINNEQLYDGYTDQEKWDHLSGGIQSINDSDSTDYSHVLGAGPFRVSDRDTAVIGFAILAGQGLDDLLVHAQAALLKWQSLALEDSVPLPEHASFVLNPCVPNPFNHETLIQFTVPKNGSSLISILDIRGREVMVLNEATDLESTSSEFKTQSVIWNGLTKQGTRAASGVYFVRLQYRTYQKIRKVIFFSGG